MAEKKKILFMAPSFMGYEKEIINELSKSYNVLYYNSEDVLKTVRHHYNSLSIICKAILKFFNPIRDRYRDRKISLHEETKGSLSFISNEKFDYVFVINGDGVSDLTYKMIRAKNPNAVFILYIWDDYKNLFKHEHICYFDIIFSYNILDCKKYKFSFLSMFTQGKIQVENIQHKEYDIAIIATATQERIQLISKILKKYKNQYKIFIYLFSNTGGFSLETHDKALSFSEYIEYLSLSKCALEIQRNNQTGPTTRANDCKFTHTKIITTNPCKENYGNHLENILFLDHSFEIPERFINSPYCLNGENGYNVSDWLNIILNEQSE